jgi:hypothetical protein
MLDDSTKRGESFAAKLTDKVADKIVGLRDVSTAVATALGINIENIAQNLARFVSAMSKETEEAFKKIATESDTTTSLLLRQLEKRRSTEQNLVVVQKEAARLQAEHAQTAEKIVESQEKSKSKLLDILSVTGSLGALLTKVGLTWKSSEESTKLIAENTERSKKLQEDAIKTDELQAKLDAERLAIGTKNFERIMQQGQEEARNAKEREKEEQDAINRQERLQGRLEKARFDALTTTQQITVLEESRVNLTENIALAESDSEESLEMQVDLIEVNNKLTELRVTQAKEVLTAEEKVTEEKEKQAKAAAEELKKRTQIVQNTYGSADKDLSDRELAEKAGNLQKQLSGARAANDSGAFFFEKKLAEVNFEIGRRSAFRNDYARIGDKAFNRYSAFDEETLRNYIRPEDERRAQQQADAIFDIQQRLSGAKKLFGGN